MHKLNYRLATSLRTFVFLRHDMLSLSEQNGHDCDVMAADPEFNGHPCFQQTYQRTTACGLIVGSYR